jgi:hypothetical protein
VRCSGEYGNTEFEISHGKNEIKIAQESQSVGKLLQVVAYGSRSETVRILRGSFYSNSMHA